MTLCLPGTILTTTQAVILGVVVVAVTTAMAATKAGMVVAEVEADRCEVAMLVADRSPTPESIQVRRDLRPR